MLHEMICRIEELSLNAWPALQSLLSDGWVLRLANGYTRRANSVNPLYAGQLDLEQKVAACERLYRDRGLAVVFKLTPASTPAELDAFLAGRGYIAEAQTSVQLLDLQSWKPDAPSAIELAEEVTDGWFDAFCRASNLAPARRPTAMQMLRAIVPAAGFAVIQRHGETVACGLAVAQDGYVGLYDIVTDPRYRRQGLGMQLISALLQWGREKDARTAYLQVMMNNPPALAMYAKLGFRELYQYWYRVKA